MSAAKVTHVAAKFFVMPSNSPKIGIPSGGYHIHPQAMQYNHESDPLSGITICWNYMDISESNGPQTVAMGQFEYTIYQICLLDKQQNTSIW